MGKPGLPGAESVLGMIYQIGDEVLTNNALRHPVIERGTRGKIESGQFDRYHIEFPGHGVVGWFGPEEIRPVPPLIQLAEIAE